MTDPAADRREPSPLRARTLVGAAIALVGLFWAAAKACGWFLDAPYLMRPIDAPRTMDSSRFLAPHETAMMLVAALFLLPAVWLAAAALRRHPAPLARLEAALGEDERAVPVLAAAAAVALAAFVAYALVQKAAILDDERAYLFQAHLFAAGKVSEPGLPAAFRNQMFIVHPLLASKYFPGNAAVLALGVLAGVPYVVHPLLAGATVLAVWSFTRDAFGRRQAELAACLTALSPFVWCVDASLLAFGTAAAAFAGMLAALARTARTGRARPTVFAGLALGLLFVTRPYDAVALGAPAGLWLVAQAWRRRVPWAAIGLAAAGFAAVAWMVPWYDHALTGSFWKTGYALDPNPIRLGFQRSFNGPYVHTAAQAAAIEATMLVRCDGWLWGLPGGIALVAAGLLRRDATPGDALLRACFAGFVVAYVLVPAPGTWDFGPTYAFVLVPVLIPLAVRGLHRAWTICGGMGPGAQERLQWGLVAFVAIGAVTVTPLRLARLTDLAAAIQAPWDFIAQAGTGDAAVVVPSIRARGAAGWGYGYPYEIPSGGGTAHLFFPESRAEYDAAMAHLHATSSLVLRMDYRHFVTTGERQFALVPFDPGAAWPAAQVR